MSFLSCFGKKAKQENIEKADPGKRPFFKRQSKDKQKRKSNADEDPPSVPLNKETSEEEESQDVTIEDENKDNPPSETSECDENNVPDVEKAPIAEQESGNVLSSNQDLADECETFDNMEPTVSNNVKSSGSPSLDSSLDKKESNEENDVHIPNKPVLERIVHRDHAEAETKWTILEPLTETTEPMSSPALLLSKVNKQTGPRHVHFSDSNKTSSSLTCEELSDSPTRSSESEQERLLLELEETKHQLKQKDRQARQMKDTIETLTDSQSQAWNQLLETEKEKDQLQLDNENLHERVKRLSTSPIEDGFIPLELTRSNDEMEEHGQSDVITRLLKAEGEQAQLKEAITQLGSTCASVEDRVHQAEKSQKKIIQRTSTTEEFSIIIENIEQEHKQVIQDINALLDKCTGLDNRISNAEKGSDNTLEPNQTDTAVERTDEQSAEANSVVKLRNNKNNGKQKIECRLSRAEEEHDQLREEISKLYDIHTSIQNRLKQVESMNDQLQKTNKCLSKENENLLNTLNDAEGRLSHAQGLNRELNDEKKVMLLNCKQMTSRMQVTESQCQELERDLALQKAKYDDMTKRFNEVAFENLASSIDIHDENYEARNLAERFRADLYGCAWSEANGRLTRDFHRDERKAVQILLEICTETYLFCRRAARQQMDSLCQLLNTPSAGFQNGQGTRNGSMTRASVGKMPVNLRKHIESFRKEPSVALLDHLQQEFLSMVEYDRSRHMRAATQRDIRGLTPYIRKCLELCWAMVVHDPPLYLKFKLRHGNDVEEDKFDTYTVHGEKVDFVVWPAVLRQEDGPLLQKGVVQALVTTPESR